MPKRSPASNWKNRFIYANRKSFIHELLHWRFLLTLTALLTLSSWLSHFWILQYAGLASMDVFATVQPTQVAERSRIVSIGEQEYETYFDARSPLEPQKLAWAIGKILELQPAVLAVDIDTSPSQYLHMAVPETKAPIVWARDARAVGGELRPKAVLGNRDVDPLHWGLAVLPYSLDWTVRTYPRMFRVGGRNWSSFHWAIVMAYCSGNSDSQCPPKTDTEMDAGELSVPTFHHRYQIPNIPLADILVQGSLPPDNNPVRNKIVLLGGYYGSDEHPTPFGPVRGVELIATAVESEFEPQGQMQNLTKYGLKIVLALLIAWLHHTLRPRYALLATLLFLGSLILAGSYIAFRVSAYRADFMPFLIGIWIEQQFESTERAHQSQKRPLHRAE
jgi:CHASE2 domain-containing protein